MMTLKQYLLFIASTCLFILCKPFARGNYPQPCPEKHLPWVWDAVYNSRSSLVELNVVFRRACYFNRTRWMQVIEQFPNYRRNLSDGSIANILIDAEDAQPLQYISGLIGNTVTCVFFSNKSTARTQSLPITVPTHYISRASTLIGCPMPHDATGTRLWHSVSVERNLHNPSLLQQDTLSKNSTLPYPISFPVHDHTQAQRNENLSPPQLYSQSSGDQQLQLQQYHQSHYDSYELAVCTATARSDRRHLVEWIEYHLLQGN
mmetsp:Transcript_16143/g.27267  ORF Transcript_16143/g.27267 Transcript_16143/m.27267 type:complete len:261 (+) Transcript_16143:251-1033(+)